MRDKGRVIHRRDRPPEHRQITDENRPIELANLLEDNRCRTDARHVEKDEKQVRERLVESLREMLAKLPTHNLFPVP